MFLPRAAVAVLVAVTLSACVTTSMQGYADRELPAKPVSRIVAYVTGPGALVTSIQSNIRDEAAKRGIEADDALLLFPREPILTQRYGRGLPHAESTACSYSMWATRE